MHWGRKWQPTLVFLPEESQGWKSLVDYSPWGRRESDTTEWLHFRFHLACKLIKQGNNIQLWHTPFSIWKQSVVPCPVLTVASWSGYRFLGRQVRWSGIHISLRIFHYLLWSTQRLSHGQWSRSRFFFLEFSCFFLWSNRCLQFDLWFLCLF